MKSVGLFVAVAAATLLPLPGWAQTPASPALPVPAAVQPDAPAAGAAAPQAVPATRWTAAQIRQAFDLADGDSSGELSRAEAQRLTILPRSFEDMDRNKDGVLARSEYEAGFAR